MKKTQAKAIFGGLAGLVLALASCNYARDGIRIAINAQPPTLDSAMTTSYASLNVSVHVFETLYTLNGDYEPVPNLAESVSVSEDGRTYTFQLRQGVLFHNGKELKAEDVVASMNRWLNNSAKAKLLLANSQFSEVGPYTVNYTVENASSDILLILSTWSQLPAIMPKEIIDATAEGQNVSEYIGTGPYKFGEWKQGKHIRLDRFNDYKSRTEEPSGFAGRKTAPTKHIYFEIEPSDAARAEGIKTDRYDVIMALSMENYDEFTRDANINMYFVPGGVLLACFNTSEGPFGENVKLRQAALAAFNCQEILLASYSNPKLYSMKHGFANTAQIQWRVDEGKELYNQNNYEKAKKLLAEAGYNGETITLLTTPDYAEMYAATLVIQKQLEKVGFNVEVVSYDFPTWTKTKSDLGAWDLVVASLQHQLTPTQLLVVTPDWAGFRHEKITQGLNRIRDAANEGEATAEWADLQGFIYDYAAASSIGHYIEVVCARKKVVGLEVFVCPVLWNARVAE
jgi:peptide/nickel transport system substrate-binding protein